jgi:hypothetical protein
MPDNGEMWIKVHDAMPEHPKISGLSDKAFRLLIETWCWCKRQRNDGRFPLAAWQRMGTARTRAELEAGQHPLVEIITEPADLASIASLAEIANHETPRSPEPRYLVVIHDWLTWQTSNDEITERREKRRHAGSIGNHKRWHLRKGVVDPDCEHCSQDRKPVASAIANPSQVGSQSDRKCFAETERSTSIQDFSSEVPVDQRAREDQQEEEDPQPRRNGARLTRDEPAGPKISRTANKIVQAYAATCRRRPAGTWLSRLGVEVDGLLGADWTEAEITDAVSELGKRGLTPSLLSSVAHELVNSDKADVKPRNVYEIPDDQLTEADIEEILGPVAQDPDLPRSSPEDVKTRAALAAWREREFPRFQAKRRERAIALRRERLARAAAKGPE